MTSRTKRTLLRLQKRTTKTTNNKRNKDDNYTTLQNSKKSIRSQQNDKLQTGRPKKTTKRHQSRRHTTSRTLSIIVDSIDGQRDEWFDVPLAALFFARLVEPPVAQNVERSGVGSVASTDAHCSAEQASKPLERSCLQLSATSGEQPCEQVPARQSEPDRAI